MFLALAFILLAVPATCQPATSTPAPAPAAGRDDEAFVRGCCARTLYPRVCTASLAPYAAAVNSSNARLAVASANLTFDTITSLGGRIPSSSTAVSSSTGALQDCVEAVASAAGLAARAAERLGGVERAVGPEVAWRVSDARTWLSAAMTYEDTCADALRPARSVPSPVRAELRAGVRRAMQHTSIALALVHMLVRTGA
uniref:Pectinesterase inhibitor domain-containing protein n=1 Tax=Leersia perrieri TaxID=77586 RepID=A0A0D9XIG1_9ORYZ